MKVLYAIQGTGNGHICRARDIIPILQQKVELDILVSGIQVDIDLPTEVKYQFKGLSFIFGKKGGVNFFQTWKKNKVRRFFQEMNSLPVEEYDLIINDFLLSILNKFTLFLYSAPHDLHLILVYLQLEV